MTDRRVMSVAPSVASRVRRAQWRVALFASTGLALTLSIAGLAVLRGHEQSSMHLVASSLAIAGEPALRFGDRAAMQELIDQVAGPARLAEVIVQNRSGAPWLRAERPVDGTVDAWARRLARALLPDAPSAEIGGPHDSIGRIALRSNGQTLTQYLQWAALCLAVSAAATALFVRWHARRLARWITGPIEALASLTREVRTSRDFARRAAPAAVGEIDALADDFNALLSELQAQQALIEARHTDLRRANESLWSLSRHDTLTGLPNRAYLGERLARVLEECRRHGSRAGLVFADSDRFKQINDRYGHAAGDALLIELASRLRSSVRESDFIARLGGDEFVIVLTPMRHPQEIDVLIERVRGSLNRPVRLPGGGELESISMSLGVAVYPDHADTIDDLIRAADAAMYRAKESPQRGATATFLPSGDAPGAPHRPSRETLP